jgi:alanyl-tRNA synthetase
LAEARASGVGTQVTEVDGVRIVSTRVDARDTEALRGQADAYRDRMGSGVVVLGAVIDGAPRLGATVTDDLVARGLSAGDLVRGAAQEIGGGGGGRPTMAEAGGKEPARLDDALAAVVRLVSDALASAE